MGNQGLVLLHKLGKTETTGYQSPLFQTFAPAIGPQSIAVIGFVPVLPVQRPQSLSRKNQ